MNEWASKILSVFPERSKGDLDQFITEVSLSVNTICCNFSLLTLSLTNLSGEQ
jgi:hypothetical protein